MLRGVERGMFTTFAIHGHGVEESLRFGSCRSLPNPVGWFDDQVLPGSGSRAERTQEYRDVALTVFLRSLALTSSTQRSELGHTTAT